MNIVRESYVEKLFAKNWKSKIRINTGIRRCGKLQYVKPEVKGVHQESNFHQELKNFSFVL